MFRNIFKSWKSLVVLIGLYLLGSLALINISYVSAPPTGSSTFIEVVKTLFLCLGGLGIIFPAYVTVMNTIRERDYNIIENTFSLIKQWDDPHLFTARKLTREMKTKRGKISDKKLLKKIQTDPELKQSIILVANYFESVRFSIVNERIDTDQFKLTLSPVILDIIDRFSVYFKKQDAQLWKDLEQLKSLLS